MSPVRSQFADTANHYLRSLFYYRYELFWGNSWFQGIYAVNVQTFFNFQLWNNFWIFQVFLGTSGVLVSYKLMPAYKIVIFFSNAMFRSCDFPKDSWSFLVPYSSFLNYTKVLCFSEYILLLLLNHFLPFSPSQAVSLSVRSF